MADIHHFSEYWETSDVDWFCRINGVNIHVASCCHRVPEDVARSMSRTYEQVAAIDMAEWRGKEKVWYNEELVRTWLNVEDPVRIARYLYTFVVMARKGFYSFAPLTMDETDGDYYMMAKPVVYEDRAVEGFPNYDVPWLNIAEVDPFTPVRLVEWIDERR